LSVVIGIGLDIFMMVTVNICCYIPVCQTCLTERQLSQRRGPRAILWTTQDGYRTPRLR